jgi:hypothetical protein
MSLPSSWVPRSCHPSRLLGPAFPLCSPQVSCTPEQISDDEVPIPHLHDTSPPQPSAHAAAPSPADSDDEVPIPRVSHTVMLW